MIKVTFECGGCDAKAEGTGRLQKHFVSVSGRDHGFGSAQWKTRVEDVVPEGWIAFDPYTYMTYCPKCWQEIVEPTRESVQLTDDPEPIAEADAAERFSEACARQKRERESKP